MVIGLFSIVPVRPIHGPRVPQTPSPVLPSLAMYLPVVTPEVSTRRSVSFGFVALTSASRAVDG